MAKHPSWRNPFLASLAAGAAALGLAQTGPAIASLSPREAFALMRADSTVLLLDVRTPGEFSGESGHLAGAVLVPVDELEGRLNELAPEKSRTILVYCRTGRRSARAVAILGKQGFHAVNVQGGIVRWSADQLPVVKER